MRKLLLAGAAALALTAIPATVGAQDAPVSGAASAALTADQQADYAGWPATQQSYFWTLSAEQRSAYFLLNAEQRGQIEAMTPAQRELAWQSIVRQLAGAPTANEANAAVPPHTETTVATRITASGQPQQVISTTSSNLAPPPPSTLGKDYPVCRGAVQDSCINPREAGLNYGNRPLDHWPGEPASETGG